MVPRSFAIYVRRGLALNQLRLSSGDAASTTLPSSPCTAVPAAVHGLPPAARDRALDLRRALFERGPAAGPADRVVGYRAKKNSLPIDLGAIRKYRWNDFWEPVYPESGSRIVLEPEIFYLLLSAEGVCIPPSYAAEMMAYDPTAGELRTHYAGFFDPGFGSTPATSGTGAGRRSRSAPATCRSWSSTASRSASSATSAWPPPRTCSTAQDAGSNYQGQVTMLSKHFREQTAAAERPDRA